MARNGFRTAQYGNVRIRKKGEFYQFFSVPYATAVYNRGRLRWNRVCNFSAVKIVVFLCDCEVSCRTLSRFLIEHVPTTRGTQKIRPKATLLRFHRSRLWFVQGNRVGTALRLVVKFSFLFYPNFAILRNPGAVSCHFDARIVISAFEKRLLQK
ncbi:hypothetical protein L596_028810 [Steinernema carpocapsae]|uniref:Uncharacterized protein n=1 Tax=Steinernema carpocapsae TaxID=34508 RepID=A0A4U5M0H5_STECR|nr:hypothetical protein L596_028810 [Steinernema carpocapsae]